MLWFIIRSVVHICVIGFVLWVLLLMLSAPVVVGDVSPDATSGVADIAPADFEGTAPELEQATATAKQAAVVAEKNAAEQAAAAANETAKNAAKHATELQQQKDSLQQENETLKHKLEEMTPPQPKEPPEVKKPHYTFVSHQDLEGAVKEAQDTHKPMCVLVVGPGCSICETIKKNVMPSTRVQQKLADTFSFAIIDAGLHPDTAKQFGVTRFPKLFMYYLGHPESQLVFTPPTDVESFLLTLDEFRS